jgi:hypothetical protein
LNVVFLVFCRRIDSKFGGDLQVELPYLFLLFFLLSSSSNSSFSSFSSEFECIHIYKAIQHIGRGKHKQHVPSHGDRLLPESRTGENIKNPFLAAQVFVLGGDVKF